MIPSEVKFYIRINEILILTNCGNEDRVRAKLCSVRLHDRLATLRN